MFSRIHQKLGTAGFIISIVALVAALGGGAWAAKGGLTGKQKKEVTKIAQTEAKKFAGKSGAPGATGPQGVAGAKGDAGAAGGPGTAGAPGANGKSVTLGTATVGECGPGGVTVQIEGEAATKKKICNGEAGVSGFTETLPPGKTEMGTFAFSAGLEPQVGVETYLPLGFNIPLTSVPSAVHYVKQNEAAPAGCAGGSAQSPRADAGVVCIYAAAEENVNFYENAGFPHKYISGLVIGFVPLLAEEATYAFGTWAATAEP